MYYEVPLLDRGPYLSVPSPGDLGDGWAIDSDLLMEIAQGYPCEPIDEADLPKPLDNPTFPGLQLYRLHGAQGITYFGIIMREENS